MVSIYIVLDKLVYVCIHMHMGLCLYEWYVDKFLKASLTRYTNAFLEE